MVDYAEKLASIARGSADALSLRVSAFDDEDAAAAEARRRAAAGERRRAADAARRDREREEEAAATRGGDGGADPMESLVKPILARHGAGCEWEDVAFPAADASLPASAHGAKWQRARQLCLAPVVFGRSSKAADADAIDPSDISQGALGTCYFLSALSVAATRPQLIRSCFVTTEPNEAGCYCVRLFRDGRPRHILVDDQLPAHGHGRPLFAASKQRDELWVSLLEKAYAKLFSSYAAIEGGHVDEALVDLTGGVGGENLSLAEEGRDPDRLWSRLTGFVHAGYLLGAGSPAGTDTDVSAEGIVQGHAYSCLRVAEEEGHPAGHGARALHAQAWLVGADQPGAPRRAERALDVYVCRRLCRGERQRRGVRPRRGPRPLVAAKGGACDGAQGRGVAPRPARASRNFLRRHARVPLWQGAGPDRLTRPCPRLTLARSPARPL